MTLRAPLNGSFSLTAYPTCFPLTQFTCNNGRCININWRCDNGKLLPFAEVPRRGPQVTARPQMEKGEVLDSSQGSLQGPEALRID